MMQLRSTGRSFVLLAIAGCLCASVGLASAQRADHDPERTQAGILVEAPQLDLRSAPVRAPLWSLAATPAQVSGNSPIVVGGGAVFFGDFEAAGSIVARARTGAIRWSRSPNATPFAVRGGLLFAVTVPELEYRSSRVVALDVGTGNVRWSVPGHWVALERQLAIVATNTRLEAYDAAGGRLQWSIPWDGATPIDARLIGSTLVVHTDESGAVLHDVLYAIDVRSGRALWTSNVNRIIAILSGGDVVLDTTWYPGAWSEYSMPLSIATVSLEKNTPAGPSRTFAPDRERWSASNDRTANIATDVSVDGDALVFRLGASTVYRYPLTADPAVVPGTRYELGPLASLGGGRWLVRLTDATAAVATIGPARTTVQRFRGVDHVTYTGVEDGIGFVFGRDRAAVFPVARPHDAVVSRTGCELVGRAVLIDDAVVAVCTSTSRLVAVALPAGLPIARETPIPVRAQPVQTFGVTVNAHANPTPFMRLYGAAFAEDGTLWYCERASFASAPVSDRIGHLRRDGRIDEFAVPAKDANVQAIARGIDGAMWFTESGAFAIGRIAADGTIREFPLPVGMPGAEPRDPRVRRRIKNGLGGITSGPDGAMWVALPFANALARVAMTGEIRIVALPATLTGPTFLTAGPDRALWFTARGAIGRLALDGSARRFAIDERTPFTSIVWGPDGNLWFSSFDGHVGRITPAGAMQAFSPPAFFAPSGPLIGGCDGAIYVADSSRSLLWRVSPHGEYVQHEIDFPIGHLARAPDCSLGFTEAQGPATGHVGTLGL